MKTLSLFSIISTRIGMELRLLLLISRFFANYGEYAYTEYHSKIFGLRMETHFSYYSSRVDMGAIAILQTTLLT